MHIPQQVFGLVVPLGVLRHLRDHLFWIHGRAHAHHRCPGIIKLKVRSISFYLGISGISIYFIQYTYIYIYIHIYTVRDITFYYGYDSMGTFIGDMNSYESPPAQRNVLFCIVSKIGRAMASKRKIWTADRNQSWLNNKERVNPGQLVANCLVIRKLFATITWLTNQTWCFFGGRYLTLVINKKMHLRKLSQRRWYYLKGTHPAKPYMKT